MIAGIHLSHLQSLVISQTHIMVGPAVLERCVSLRELEVAPSHLTEQGLRTLLSLPAFRSLRVFPHGRGVQEMCDLVAGGGRFSQEEMDRLRQLCDAGQSRACSDA